MTNSTAVHAFSRGPPFALHCVMFRSPLWAVFAFACGVGLSCIGSRRAVAQAAPDERLEVRELKVTGTHAVPKGELENSLATKASGCRSLLLTPFCLVTKSRFVFERRYLDRDEFSRDVLRALVFYFRRGYRDAAVDTTIVRVGPSAVRIALAVREGPPTRITQSVIEASPDLVPPLDSARLLRPRPGDALNLLVVDSTVLRVRDALWERGFAEAVVQARTQVDSAADSATLRIAVNPKRRITIGEIVVEGNERVSTDLIRRSLYIEPGDLFRLSRIGRSQRALYESALFRRAIIDTVPRDALTDTTRGLVVRVQEAPPREARASIGFTTADFAQVEARFTDHHWLRSPRRLDLSATVGNLLAQQLTRSALFVNFTNIARDNALGRYYSPTYQASADVTERWFGSPRNTLGLGVFTHRRSSPGVFVDRGYGVQTSFTRELGIRIPASATYRFEISRVEAGGVYFCVNYGVCDDNTIAALRGEQRLSPLSLTLNVDRANAPLSPTRGFRVRTELEHASRYTASDFRYHRAVVDAAAYLPLSFRRVLRRAVGAAHVRIGWVHPLASTAQAVGIRPDDASLAASDVLHPRKRFYAGGAQSVRGFGENQLGPRVLTIAPEVLRGRTVVNGDTTWVCAPSADIRSCSVNAEHLRDGDFQVRPLGGTTLLEASIELRMPVWRGLVGAVFLDGAVLGEGNGRGFSRGTGALTPGFGVRYETPVGPIRVDLGVRPPLRRALTVITQAVDSTGQSTLVTVGGGGRCTETGSGCRVFPDPAEKQSFFRSLTNRLTLHLSIGQAF